MAAARQHKSRRGFAGLPVAVKLLILVLMLGSASAIYYVAFHLPLASDIDDAEQRHSKLKQDLSKAKQRRQEYLRLTQKLANRKAMDQRNRRVLPEDAEIASFLQDLNRLGELSGLQLRLVEPRPEERQNLYVRLPVNLQITGRYHQLMKFFYNVSQLERVINMENITLTNPRRKGEEVLLDVDVLATTFRRTSQQAGANNQGQGQDKGKGQQ